MKRYLIKDTRMTNKHIKTVNIISHWENVNQNHNELSLILEWLKLKRLATPSIDQEVENINIHRFVGM